MKAKIIPVKRLLALRQLPWFEYVIQLPDNRLPPQLLCGELSQGQRSAGRPKKRFSDHIRITLQKCNIQLSDLEASASDRDVWRTLCEVGLNNFMNNWINTSTKRHAARHMATAKPKTGPHCPHCNRLCLIVPAAAEFGLRTHLQIHTSTRLDNS